MPSWEPRCHPPCYLKSWPSQAFRHVEVARITLPAGSLVRSFGDFGRLAGNWPGLLHCGNADGSSARSPARFPGYVPDAPRSEHIPRGSGRASCGDADGPARPVQQYQTRLQRHRQAAFVARSATRRLFTHFLTRWLQRDRSQPTCLPAMFSPRVLRIWGADFRG